MKKNIWQILLIVLLLSIISAYARDRNSDEVLDNLQNQVVDKKVYISSLSKEKIKNEIININYENTSSGKKYLLEDMIKEIVYKDPEIKERLYQYNSIMEDINISKSGYYPTVDFVGKIGRVSNKKERFERDSYSTSELTLRVVQNLFNGFGTKAAVSRDEARAKSNFNKYIEVAQDKIYKAIEYYLKVIRYKEVLKIAKDNVKVHEETLLRIKKRYDEGFSTLSEVERVEGRLALSRSNFISETNNLYDAKFNFHKALGRYVSENLLEEPVFRGEIPKSLEEAKDIAIRENPSILVANYDIKSTKMALKYEKKDFYPKLDLELKASKYNNKSSSTTGDEEDLSALLVLNYNLYNGGKDKASKQKYISLVNYEYEHKNKLKRDVIESLGLSWTAKKLIENQQKYQMKYQKLTSKTKDAYTEEFQLGRRTLIDLLDVQDEVNNIKIKVIHNKYDLLFSNYRILDAMGRLYQLFGYSFKEDYKEDILFVPDQDKDGKKDVLDQCDNSKIQKTNKYGCEKLYGIEIQQVEFNKEIEDDENQIDVSDVQELWNVK